MTSTLTHLDCPRCGDAALFDARATICRCGGPLFARYDAARAGRTLTRAALAARAPGLWRFEELLPPVPATSRVTLGEGGTPTLSCPRLAEALGVGELWVKDESPNPTGSFKARGLAMAVSVAHHAGLNRFAVPSAGNAGLALAAYAARAGAEATVVLPRDVPHAFLRATTLLGADVRLVEGVISDAGRVVAALRDEHGLRDLSTLREPFRLEGKKTMGFEIAEVFPEFLPDVIVYPTGGGTGLIGIWKAFAELRAAGWLGDATVPALPRLVCVQSAGCAPVVHAFRMNEPAVEPWADARTVAAGLRVPRPFADREILAAIRASGGTAIAVEDADILECARLAASRTGLAMCPEGAATVSATKALVRSGWLAADARVLLLNTGSAALNQETIDAGPRAARSVASALEVQP